MTADTPREPARCSERLWFAAGRPRCRGEATVTVELFRLPIGRVPSPPIRLRPRCREHADELIRVGVGYATEVANG